MPSTERTTARSIETDAPGGVMIRHVFRGSAWLFDVHLARGTPPRATISQASRYVACVSQRPVGSDWTQMIQETGFLVADY